MSRPNVFLRTLIRSLRLRCPRCGQSKLFRNPWSMRDACPACELRYEREAGFFLGTIYFNYGLTALIASIMYPIMSFAYRMPRQQALLITLGFVVLFPLWFFRYARSLWLGFDHFVDPPEE